ncbi:MAG: hypothetical protein K8W52_06725 [Deltaproteobacteria bacterium]|nr:hypothetical protein [Deltaproteobacteria bacterium]
MPSYCDLVVIENDRREHRWSRNSGQWIETEIFWGPIPTLAFIREFDEVVPDHDWSVEGWAEGGVILDLDRRVLTWFGGEMLDHDVRLRRRFMELAAYPWRGFELRWANERVATLADLVGVPRDKLLREPRYDSFKSPADPDAIDGRTLITVRGEDGVMRWACPDVGWYVVRTGERLLEVARAITRTHPGVLPDMPGEGIHIDLATREIEAWTGHHGEDLAARLARAYPGWSTRSIDDRFEEHLARVARVVTLPPEDIDAAIRRMWDSRSPKPPLSELLTVDAQTDPTKLLDGPPLPFRAEDMPPSVEQDWALLRDAIAAWRAR